MVIEHEIEKADYSLVHDHTKTMGKSWANELDTVLKSEYMSNLMFLIDQVYACPESTFPRMQRDIFNSYSKTPYEQVSVVIFGNEPHNMMSNGLAFGEYGSTGIIKNPKLRLIQQNLMEEEQLNFFDKSLIGWTQQGVMLLNTSLISSKDLENKYGLYFRELIRQTIKSLNDKVGIVFCFTDDHQAKNFEKYIDKDYNHVLKYPVIDCHCTIFDDINKLLIEEKMKTIVW